jgi:hypothetical protein
MGKAQIMGTTGHIRIYTTGLWNTNPLFTSAWRHGTPCMLPFHARSAAALTVQGQATTSRHAQAFSL